MIHTVKIFKWVNGVLDLIKKVFNSLLEALNFVEKNKEYVSKVYNQNEELVYTNHSCDSGLYA